jgi:hypothetical protein
VLPGRGADGKVPDRVGAEQDLETVGTFLHRNAGLRTRRPAAIERPALRAETAEHNLLAPPLTGRSATCQPGITWPSEYGTLEPALNPSSSRPHAPWWQSGVIYQIYPRSFQDSTGDGTGDLPGITRRIPYLRWLGVDAVWISPFYRSPMADFGYDVADHRDVDPLFGTLADFDALVAAAHDQGIRVIVDYVPNHTSDQHPWFLESRRSRDSAKRGWYLWRDPAADGGPPNNWLSNFGGPAWTFDEATGQYYGHAYLPEQPDLNWHHPGCAPRCWTCCGSGSIAEWTASGSTRSGRSARTRRCATTRPTPAGARATIRTLDCCPSTRPTAPRRSAGSPRCARIADAAGDTVLVGELYVAWSGSSTTTERRIGRGARSRRTSI